jgi:4-methylaminobutanoate oxidase (formaldehyde-forming)
MSRLARRAVEWLLRLSADTGEPLEIVRSGSLKAARRAEDAETLGHEAARGERLGLGTRVISPEAAHRLHPFFQPIGVRAVLHTPGDVYFEPSHVGTAYAAAAGKLGATLLPNTTATGIHVRNDRVEGVETDRGRIDSPVVVDAAGAWARQVAAAAGIHVPMVPTRHQVLITDPVEGATPELPIVRIMDAAVYARPCWGGFLAGGYETEPTQFEMERLPPTFSIADTPLDLGVLRRLMEGVREQMPILSTAPLRLHRGGIPTMTPDGQHIVGPVPGAAGFFVASGCNVAGCRSRRSSARRSRGGSSTAGRPRILARCRSQRFGPEWRDEEKLRRAAAWEYRHFYSYDAPAPNGETEIPATDSPSSGGANGGTTGEALWTRLPTGPHEQISETHPSGWAAARSTLALRLPLTRSSPLV